MKEYSHYAVVPGGKVLFEIKSSTKGMITDTEATPVSVAPKGKKAPIDFQPWGANNDLPFQLITNSYANTTVASNLEHNATMAYGEALAVMKRVLVNDKLKHVPVLRSDPAAAEIFDFIDNNNLSLLIQEQIHDQTLLHNSFVELIFNNERSKIVRMAHKEASYSRLSVMNEKNGEIEYHGYSAKWKENKAEEDLVITPLLDFDAPLYDLKRRRGLVPHPNGKLKKENHPSYVMHIARPSPGRFYYQKAYWWAIFESGWYDFSCAIPEFKLNLLKNQMVLKYHVQISDTFFPRLFKTEGITDDKEQKTRMTQFFKDMEDFLSGKENAGKNLISYMSYNTTTGKEEHDIIIKPIESFIKGGEYIEDSEEATNVISNAMGVHPSLQGASPGKNKTINGTEARELFNMKQALMKPLRDLILQPLNVVKAINGWDPDIDFVIPHMQLTTLDKNTGAEKTTGIKQE